MEKLISAENPRITFTPEVFVDHEKNGRSGHLGHAMVKCADGSLLAFYSNDSGKAGYYRGHTMYGWVEYKRSHDNGLTWSEPTVLPYAWDAFIDGVETIGCEKATCCDDGTIVLYCLSSVGKDFEPYGIPHYLLSRDNGYTWSEPVQLYDKPGRIYDSRIKDGCVYCLFFVNPEHVGAKPEDVYVLLTSTDNGKTFETRSVLPFDAKGHAYGNIFFRPDGTLVFYGYKVTDEYHLTVLESKDNGLTWSEPMESEVKKIARNPQIGYLKGWYILCGRSENGVNYVFYYSKDGMNWSNGILVNEGRRGGCYYSNIIPVTGADGEERLLVQYSESYAGACTNICHAWIDIRE